MEQPKRRSDLSRLNEHVQEKVGRSKKDEEGLTYGLMSAGTKADSEGTLVRPNQVNDQVNDNKFYWLY